MIGQRFRLELPDGVVLHSPKPFSRETIACLRLDPSKKVVFQPPIKSSPQRYAASIRARLGQIVRRRNLPYRFHIYLDERDRKYRVVCYKEIIEEGTNV